MTASGWYADPSGTASLRFWDGQVWTTATAPVPFDYAPAAAQYPPAPPFTPNWPAAPVNFGYGAPPPNQPRGTPFKAAAAGLVAILVLATAVVVIVGTRHHRAGTNAPKVATAGAPTSESLARSLLAADEVGAATRRGWETGGAGYSINGYPSGCPGLAYIPGAQPVQASVSFLAENLTIEESFSSLPGTAQSVVHQFAQAAGSCHSAEIDGARMSVTAVALPDLLGVDQGAGVLMQGQIRGKLFAVEFGLVRVGDTVLGLSVFAEGPPNQVGPTLQQLLPVAVDKARRTR